MGGEPPRRPRVGAPGGAGAGGRPGATTVLGGGGAASYLRPVPALPRRSAAQPASAHARLESPLSDPTPRPFCVLAGEAAPRAAILFEGSSPGRAPSGCHGNGDGREAWPRPRPGPTPGPAPGAERPSPVRGPRKGRAAQQKGAETPSVALRGCSALPTACKTRGLPLVPITHNHHPRSV